MLPTPLSIVTGLVLYSLLNRAEMHERNYQRMVYVRERLWNSLLERKRREEELARARRMDGAGDAGPDVPSVDQVVEQVGNYEYEDGVIVVSAAHLYDDDDDAGAQPAGTAQPEYCEYLEKCKFPEKPSREPDTVFKEVVTAASTYTVFRTGVTVRCLNHMPNFAGPFPTDECQIFCSGFPHDMTEGLIIALFERYGTIWEIRFSVDILTGKNLGYGFVRFTSQASCVDAVAALDGHELRPRVFLRVTRSKPRRTLYVSNLTKSEPKCNLLNEFSRLLTGVVNLHIRRPNGDFMENRGFGFLEFDSHLNAFNAKLMMCQATFPTVCGSRIYSDWADDIPDPDDDVMSQVKNLYLSNLRPVNSENQLWYLFSNFGIVRRVKQVKTFAFVHFETRDQASDALTELQGFEFQGRPLEISWAKPPPCPEKKLVATLLQVERTMAAEDRRDLNNQNVTLMCSCAPGEDPVLPEYGQKFEKEYRQRLENKSKWIPHQRKPHPDLLFNGLLRVVEWRYPVATEEETLPPTGNIATGSAEAYGFPTPVGGHGFGYGSTANEQHTGLAATVTPTLFPTGPFGQENIVVPEQLTNESSEFDLEQDHVSIEYQAFMDSVDLEDAGERLQLVKIEDSEADDEPSTKENPNTQQV